MTVLFGSGRARFVSKAALALVALLTIAPVMEATVAFAENDGSGAAELRAKRKAMRGGGSFTSSKQRASQQTLHTPVATGKATTVTEIVADQSVQPFLSANATADMAAAENHYAAIVAAGGWPIVPKGTYKKGAQSSAVGALNKRLFIEGYLRAEGAQGEFADVFTSATQDSVTRFQRNMGLAVTGNVDGSTLAALNVPASNRLATIRANIARVAMYSQDLGDRYIVVNVPAQQIQAVNGGKVFSQHNAIVGRPERPTPVVMTALSDINFNPYWNAPASIIERDIIPKINNGSTDILEKMNIKVFKGFGGPEIDPDTVDWDRAIADDYHFRQEPGGENAMATAKINFQSPFGIYLHDTPERQLFKSGGRFFSSGCVRVDQVAILLNWILNGQDGIDQSRIANLGETLERLDVKVTAPPQLRVAYLTSWPVGGGLAAFRSDVYQLDGTGFVIGQPMPVGETSPDGQRFVLKPIARQVAAVDAAEAEGFTWFGRKFSGGKSATVTKKAPTASKTLTADKDDDAAETKPGNSAKAKTVASAKPKSTMTARASKNGKKAYKGLFDWGNYYAEQKSDGSVKKPIKAKATAKADAKSKKAKAEVAKTDGKAKKPAPDAKAVAQKGKKPTADTKAVADKGKKPAADTKAVADKSKKPADDAKVVADKGKKPTTDAKVLASKDKKPATDTKTVADKGKKPAAEPAKAKKPQVDCAKDKKAKECVTAAVVNKKKPVAAAAN